MCTADPIPHRAREGPHIVQLNPEEMEGRLTRVYERNLTTTMANIEHIESTTVNGEAIVKILLQPDASLEAANAQVTAISQTILRPAAARNPATALIINYSASSVPILLGLMPGTFGAAARNANNPPGSSPRNRVLYGLRLICRPSPPNSAARATTAICASCRPGWQTTPPLQQPSRAIRLRLGRPPRSHPPNRWCTSDLSACSVCSPIFPSGRPPTDCTADLARPTSVQMGCR